MLGTTPNWLLRVVDKLEKQPKERALIDRFNNAGLQMTLKELELSVIQAEAVAAKSN